MITSARPNPASCTSTTRTTEPTLPRNCSGAAAATSASGAGPANEMAAADGAAGGFTHDYNAVCDAVFSVKNADSGYDAARDCLVALVSPSYTAADESDEVWDKQLEYWAAVSKLLKHKRNVCLGFREQFLRGDNNRKRILEMSQALGTREGGPGLFLFSVSPASLYEMGPLFAPVPAAMSQLNEGADVVYYMCGRIFQEPLILLNASHTWNTDSLGAIAVPETAAQCYAFCNSPVYQARGTWADKETAGIYGPGGFLELACRRLYGTKTGKHMEKVYEMKAPVIAYAYGLFDRFGRRADWHWDWKPELERTREAIAHVEAALNEPDCRAESRPILERFWKCLNAGKHFAEIRLEFQELVLLAAEAASTPEDVESKAEIVENRIQAMEAFLKDHFTYDWATPLGGDILSWNDHLADMRGVLSSSVKSWTNERLAHQVADREQAQGGGSPLVNGDMESSGGWKFVAVTGKELAGYADGGYVEDKASSGKRSYRIIKREATQDATPGCSGPISGACRCGRAGARSSRRSRSSPAGSMSSLSMCSPTGTGPAPAAISSMPPSWTTRRCGRWTARAPGAGKRAASSSWPNRPRSA